MENKRHELYNVVNKSKLTMALRTDSIEEFKYIVGFHHDPVFFQKEVFILETIDFESNGSEINNSDYFHEAINHDSVRIFEYLVKCSKDIHPPNTVQAMFSALESLGDTRSTRILNFIMESGLINPYRNTEKRSFLEKNFIKNSVSSLVRTNKKEFLNISINNGLDLRKFDHDFTADVRTNYPVTDDNAAAENMIKFLIKNGSKYDSVMRGIEKGIYSTDLTMFVLHQNAKEKQEVL